MTQAHAYDTAPTPLRSTSPLVPVDIDAAVDGPRMLMAVHERVERQFAAYEQAEGSHARQHHALRAIGAVLATHVVLEDELLYPALRAQTGRHDHEIERQLEQDHLLDMIMVELRGMIPSDPRYDAKVGVLMQVFRQHAHDAEALLVPELRRRLNPAERELLGRRLLERVGQLEGRARSGW
jgi:serine phosphatase RsbU (regulator of sigma subunit)